ncbi:TPA: hypothetical protein ACWZU0_003402 [Klebsiella oxytoca]
MQILFCSGKSAKTRCALARGFFRLAISVLRSGNAIIEVKNHEGSRESILQGGEVALLCWSIKGKRYP